MPPKKKKPTGAAAIEPNDEDGNLSGMDRYIRRLYRQPWFPNVDEKGMVCKKKEAGVTGKQALENRIVLEGKTLANHLRQHFPQSFIHCANAPQQRALIHRPSQLQATLFSQKTLPKWSDTEMKKDERVP